MKAMLIVLGVCVGCGQIGATQAPTPPEAAPTSEADAASTSKPDAGPGTLVAAADAQPTTDTDALPPVQSALSPVQTIFVCTRLTSEKAPQEVPLDFCFRKLDGCEEMRTYAISKERFTVSQCYERVGAVCFERRTKETLIFEEEACFVGLDRCNFERSKLVLTRKHPKSAFLPCRHVY